MMNNDRTARIEINGPLLLWAACLLLKPFYVFDSGLPQPADFLLAALALGLILRGKVYIARRHVSFTLTTTLFFAYVCLVNGAWAVILGSPNSLIRTLPFYAFNLGAAVVFLSYYHSKGQELLRYTSYGVGSSLLLQAMLMLPGIAGYRGTRMVAFFNNPNQLGYFALLGLALVALLGRRVWINQLMLVSSIVSGYFLLSVSLSKAALAAAMLLIPTYWPLLTRSSRQVFAIVLLLLLFMTQLQFIAPGEHPLVQAVTRRLSSIGRDADDSLGGRGYDRIFNHPEYLFLGAGEIAIGSRSFDSKISLEIHSTLGNLLFSYGSIGFGLFCLLVLRVLRGKGFLQWLPLASVMVYGLTHNGIRQTWLWILLTVMLTDPIDQPMPRLKEGGVN